MTAARQLHYRSVTHCNHAILTGATDVVDSRQSRLRRSSRRHSACSSGRSGHPRWHRFCPRVDSEGRNASVPRSLHSPGSRCAHGAERPPYRRWHRPSHIPRIRHGRSADRARDRAGQREGAQGVQGLAAVLSVKTRVVSLEQSGRLRLADGGSRPSPRTGGVAQRKSAGAIRRSEV